VVYLKVETLKREIIKTNKNNRKKGPEKPNIRVIYLVRHAYSSIYNAWRYLIFLYLNNDYYVYSNLNASAFNQTTRQRAITADTRHLHYYSISCACTYKLFQHLLRGMHRASISHIIVHAPGKKLNVGWDA